MWLKGGFADLAVWKFNKNNSAIMFGRFLDSINCEQDLLELTIDNNDPFPFSEKARGSFNWFWKGIKYAKRLKHKGLAH